MCLWTIQRHVLFTYYLHFLSLFNIFCSLFMMFHYVSSIIKCLSIIFCLLIASCYSTKRFAVALTAILKPILCIKIGCIQGAAHTERNICNNVKRDIICIHIVNKNEYPHFMFKYCHYNQNLV